MAEGQKYSGGVHIAAGQGDFLAPSQDCVKPIEILNRKTKRKAEVKGARSAAPVAISLDDAGIYFEHGADGKKEQLEEAKITLNDCLACSGCVTSAETVLITQQSKEEFFSTIAADPTRVVVVTVAPQVRASLAVRYAASPSVVQRQLEAILKSFGVTLVVDSSFGRELALLEACHEFVAKERRAGGAAAAFPLLASSCPGWICYAEKTQGEVLPYISRVKSPQQVMGSLVKDYIGGKLGVAADRIYHVALMPCYDKKLEASRDDFYDDILRTRDVDTVLTASEMADMVAERGIDFLSFSYTRQSPIASEEERQRMELVEEMERSRAFWCLAPDGSFAGPEGSSGGWAETILAFAAKELHGIEEPVIRSKSRPRNTDLTELWVEKEAEDGVVKVLRFAQAFGFRNIQNIVRQVKRRKCAFQFVEVMACPAGCVNGGGQVKPTAEQNAKELLKQVEAAYHEDYVVTSGPPGARKEVADVYDKWLGERGSQKARQALYTQYHKVEQLKSIQAAIQW